MPESNEREHLPSEWNLAHENTTVAARNPENEHETDEKQCDKNWMVDRKEKKRQENGWKTDASGRKWGGAVVLSSFQDCPSCSASGIGIGAVTLSDRIDQGSRIPSLALGLMADTDDSPSRAAVQAAARWLTKVCVCMWWVACIAGHLHQTGYETVRGGGGEGERIIVQNIL